MTERAPTHRLLADFGRHEHRAMVAAALEILASFADSAEARHAVLGPWAWDLRQRARALEATGARIAAAEAKAIARVVGAAALGELSRDELAVASAAIDVEPAARLAALGVLRVAMHS